MGQRARYRTKLKRKKAYHKRRKARVKAVIEATKKS